ncbi:MAG: type II glyceraldehyde-3-phosphate dehydrogenase, partial [Christensenellales bacterium]
MAKVKVGVAGYGVIGQRLADGVAAQGDMELVGVADVMPTLSVQALKHKGMPYRMFNAMPGNNAMEEAGIP